MNGLRILALFALLAPAGAFAQAGYPAKPVRLLIPILAGSISDLVGRALGQELGTRLGQPLVVENRPAAAGIVSAETCARSAPDGYAICITNAGAMSFNPHIFTKLPYDPERDFKPVAKLYYLIEALIASSSLAPGTVKEVQAFALANPGKLNFATNGPNTGPDIFRQWLSRHWGSELVGIGYKGGPPIMAALMAGEVQLTWQGAGNVGGLINTGKLKVLMVRSDSRSALWPGVPTAAEAGLDGFPVRQWFGLVAPAGTPDAIVNRLHSELVRIYGDPKVLKYLESQFVEPALDTPEAFGAFLRADRERIGQVVRDFNIPRQ